MTASDTLYMEEHLEAIVGKVNLDAEDAFLQRYDQLPEYIRSCLELNYLLVLSTRPPNRWLLAATGLEALAVGTIGPQDTVSSQLAKQQRGVLMRAVRDAVEAVGPVEIVDRIVQRVLGTTTGPVADHVHQYLARHGIHDASPDDINRWWRTRGSLAHGEAVDIDLGDLNHLINVFQVALRRTAGAEPIPPPPPAADPDPAPGDSHEPAIRVRGTGEAWGRPTCTYWDAPSAPKVVRIPNGAQDDAEHPLHARRNDRVSAKVPLWRGLRRGAAGEHRAGVAPRRRLGRRRLPGPRR